MNQADSDIITTLLGNGGYRQASSEEEAGIILLNTCAVRENAVERIAHYLQHLKGVKKRYPDLLVGLSGCIPQYQREALFDDFPLLDFLAGPDTYRALPSLIAEAASGCRRVSRLDFDTSETYVGVEPSRSGTLSAFVPVMRGCNNMCAFCVVPFTRGRERSHPPEAVPFEYALRPLIRKICRVRLPKPWRPGRTSAIIFICRYSQVRPACSAG